MREKSSLDYIVIGAHKAGTSWLYQMLKELPDFAKIPIKEIHYFDLDSSYDDIKPLRDKDFVRRLSCIKWWKECLRLFYYLLKYREYKSGLFFHFVFKEYNDEWYHDYFSYFKKIRGDITPSYSRLKLQDVERLAKQCSSKTKIIFILRDPVARSWSNFKHARRLGLYENVDDDQISKILTSQFVHDRSNYLQSISNYQRYFFEQQFRIFYFDDMKDDPQKFMKEIVSFIGGDVTSVDNLNFTHKINVGMDIPLSIVHKNLLTNEYHNDMKVLADRYEGHCRKWYNKYFN